jgi:MYXO-CTERM domain-containing protein
MLSTPSGGASGTLPLVIAGLAGLGGLAALAVVIKRRRAMTPAAA